MAGSIVAANSAAAGSGTNIPVTVPGTHQAGDVLLGIAHSDWGSAADGVFGPSTGTWTPLGNTHESGQTANGMHARLWGIAATGSETSFTFLQNGDSDATATIVRARGVTLTGALYSGAFASNGPAASAPSLSGVTAGGVLLCGITIDAGHSPTTWTPPTGMDELADVQSGIWTSTGIAGLVGPPDPSVARSFTVSPANTAKGIVWSLFLPAAAATGPDLGRRIFVAL